MLTIIVFSIRMMSQFVDTTNENFTPILKIIYNNVEYPMGREYLGQTTLNNRTYWIHNYSITLDSSIVSALTTSNTTITLDVPEEMTIGEETIINGTLSGLYGRINYNQVTVYINNGKYYLYTDDDGEFFLPYKATSMGIKNVTAIYYGDEQRTNSSNSKQINVVKKKTNITQIGAFIIMQ